MQPTTLGIFLVATLLLIAALFILSAVRRTRTITALDVFVQNYAFLCEYKTFPIEILENMYELFGFTRHPRLAAIMLSSLYIQKSSDQRSDYAKENTSVQAYYLENPEAGLRAYLVYQAIYTLASYALPIVGPVLRRGVHSAERQPFSPKMVAVAGAPLSQNRVG